MISDKLTLYAEVKTRGKSNVVGVYLKCVAFNSHLSCDLFLCFAEKVFPFFKLSKERASEGKLEIK